MKREIVKLDYLREDREIYQSSEYIRTLYWDSSRFIQNLFNSLLQAALSLVPARVPDSPILDVGTAEGPFLPTLSKYFKQVVGLDINYDHIKVAQNIMKYPLNKLCNVLLSIADGSALPFKTNSFKIVFCMETLEHVVDIPFVLNEISRVLTRGGVLIASVPIETGLSLLIRQIAGKILRFQRDEYNQRELSDAILERNLESRRKREDKMHSHRFFSWRNILKELEGTTLKLDSLVFTPFSASRLLSTNVTFRAINR